MRLKHEVVPTRWDHLRWWVTDKLDAALGAPVIGKWFLYPLFLVLLCIGGWVVLVAAVLLANAVMSLLGGGLFGWPWNGGW